MQQLFLTDGITRGFTEERFLIKSGGMSRIFDREMSGMKEVGIPSKGCWA